jgi:hypothetical protein
MPNQSNHTPTNSESSSSTLRHSRRSSRSQTERDFVANKEAARSQSRHRREKSNAHAPPPPPPSHGPIASRPALKNRAKSAPLIPNHNETDPARQRGHTQNGNESTDDEISGDPFFQRYSAPQSQEAHTSPHLSQQENEEHHSPNLNHRPKHIVTSYAGFDPSQSNPASPMYQTPLQTPPVPQPYQEINVAVVGSPKVGKSTFIQQAFDLGQMPLVHFTRRKMSLDGTIYVVRLIELSYRDLDLDDDQCICWPDVIDGQPVPAIDGAFTLYDVTNKDSLIQMPETLCKWFVNSIFRLCG